MNTGSTSSTSKQSQAGAVASAVFHCPRCGGVLRFPDTIAACISCGYSRGAPASPNPAQPSPSSGAHYKSEALETLSYALRLPAWLWVLFLGCIAIIGIGLAANYMLPASSMRRTLLSTTTVLICVAGLMAAQVWVLIILTIQDARVGLSDVLNPISAWILTIRELPVTRWPMCVGSWCVSALLVSTLAVGGLDYWMPGKMSMRQKATGFLQAFLGSDSDRRPELDDWIPPEEHAAVDPGPEPDQDPRPTLTCVIVGFLPDEAGGLKSLVLAHQDGKMLQFAGIVDSGIGGARGKRLRQKLAAHVTTQPALADPRAGQAVWVKPVSCLIHQSGLAATGLLLEPKFAQLIDEKVKTAS